MRTHLQETQLDQARNPETSQRKCWPTFSLIEEGSLLIESRVQRKTLVLSLPHSSNIFKYAKMMESGLAYVRSIGQDYLGRLLLVSFEVNRPLTFKLQALC